MIMYCHRVAKRSADVTDFLIMYRESVVQKGDSVTDVVAHSSTLNVQTKINGDREVIVTMGGGQSGTVELINITIKTARGLIKKDCIRVQVG